MSAINLSSNKINVVKVSDGQNGQSGYTQVLLYLYQRASSAPSRPTTSSYNPNNGTLIANGSWVSSISSTTGTNPCYVTTVFLSIPAGTTQAISIDTNQWSNPVVLVQNGQNGQDGTSVSISSIKYAAGTSGTSHSGLTFDTSIPSVPQGGWLWVETTYSNGSQAYSCSYMGTDGEDGNSVTVTSTVKVGKTTTVTLTNSDGTTQTFTIDDGEDGENGQPGAPGQDGTPSYVHFAWANSADGTTDFSTSVSSGKSYMGVYTDSTQQDSQTPSDYSWTKIVGRGVYSVIEYYKANNDSAVAPTGDWGTSVLTPTEQLPYVWNYEVVNYTDGTTSSTTKHVVAMYGASGAAGRGISDIEDQYAKSSTTTAPADNQFSTTIPTLDETNKYLWNREKITYTDNTDEYTSKRIIGMYSKDGTSVTVTNIYYGTSNSSSTQPSSWTQGSPTNIQKGVWLWIKTVFSDSSEAITCSYTGNDGQNGQDGTSVSIYSQSIAYKASNSGSTIPSGTWSSTVAGAGAQPGDYLWTRTIVNYTTNGQTVSSTTTSYSVSRIGSDGAQGAQGPAGQNGQNGQDGTSVSILNQEIKYQASDSGDTTPTGTWSSTVAGAGAQAGQFLWTRTTVNYTTDSTTISNSTVSYSVSRIGTNGTNGQDGVNSAILYIYQRKSGTAPTAPANDVVYVFADGDYTQATKPYLSPWQMTIPTNDGNPCYVATAAAISSSDRDTILGTNAGQNCDWTVSQLVANGTNGTNGISITGVVEQYAINNSNTTPPEESSASWGTQQVSPTSSQKYLWNREVISYSNGNSVITTPHIASMYVSNGAAGRGISSIENKYAINNNSGTAPTTWENSPMAPTSTYPYLWNQETITYTSGSPITTTTARVIGTYSENGYNQATVYVYKRSSTPLDSNTYTPTATKYTFSTKQLTGLTSGWNQDMPLAGNDPCYISCAVAVSRTDEATPITFATPTKLVQNGAKGDTGAQGPQGPAGQNGTNGYNYIILYYYIRSADTPTKPQGTYTYNFEDKSISPSISNWQQTIPSIDGNPCWVTTISFLGNTTSVSGQSFTDPVKFVVDGEDANQYTIRTGTEEVLKFVKSGSTYNNKTYDFSPEEFSFYGFDIKGQSFLYNQQHDSDKYCTLTIQIDNYKLSEVIKAANYSTYVYTDNSNYINYNFNIGALYTAYLNGLSSQINTSYSSSEKQAILDAIGNFFSNTSQSLSFVIVGKVIDGADSYNIEKYISVKNGLAEEMMNFSINAGNITAAIQDAGLKFGSDGLTVTNTGFKIQSDADGTLKNVFYVDSDTHQLIMNGNGTFTGTVYAEDGSFNGTVTAARGSIGGFNITDNSIESWTKNLGLFSQISVDPGTVEQGSIVNHVDSDSNYRLRTDYISILPGQTYIINTNIEYVYVHSYSSNTSSSFVSASGWKSGVNYSYTAPSTANYIRIVLAKNTGTTTTLVSPTDVSYFTIMQEDSSLIKVENIKIGDGGEVDGYLRVGNLSLINPDKSEDNAVIKLEVPNDGVYFKLTNEGYIEGNNWSIKKEPGNNYVIARFGKLIAEDGEFNGTIHATDGTFTGTVVSSIISASTINTANFITENTRSLGGSFVFKPTFEINSITDKGSNVLEFNLANASEYFKFGVTDTIDVEIPDNKDGYYIDENGVDTVTTSQGCIDQWIKVTPNLTYTIVIMPGYKAAKRIHEYSGMDEVGGAGKPSTWLRQKWSKASSSVTTGSQITATITVSSDANYIRISRSRSDTVTITRVPDQIVSISGVDCRYGTITAIDTSNNMCKISANFKTTDYNILKVADALSNYQTLTLFGKDNNDLLIGINSDDLHAGDILPPRALAMETFSKVIDANGTGNLDYNINLLLGDLNSLKEQSSKFNYVKGYGLYADNVYLHGSLMTENGAGSYAGVHTTKDLDFSYASWGGENTDSYAGEKIIFWGGSNSLDDIDIQTSPFIVTDKGSIFANRGEFKGTVITNSLISNARIETPIIYGTGNNPSLRIYDTDNSKMGIGFYKADETLTLNISNIGFSHYYNNILTSFIQFSDNDNSIYFTGTSFTAGNTIYSSQSIQDGQANIQINGNSGGNVKLVYNTNSGVEVTEGLVRNFGGQVVNEGTMQIVDNTKYLKYTVNNGYYCLYVES